MATNQSTIEREQIANRLKEARTLSGLSQDGAAKLLGLPRPAISEIESAKRKVSAEELHSFSKLYKVSVSWLLRDKNDTESEFDDQIKVAARELGKMSEDDRKKLYGILKILPR